MAERSFRARFAPSAYLYVPLLALIALLQASVGRHLVLLGATPDFMLLSIVAWGLLRGVGEGVLWGFVGGMWLSVFSGGPFGVAALVLMGAGALAGAGHSTVYRGRLVLPVVMTMGASAASALLWLFALYVTGRSVPWLSTLVRVALPSMMLNSLLIIPAYAIFRWLDQRTGREVMQW